MKYKKVTSEHAKKAIAFLKMNENDFEFSEDYSAKNPTTKIYKHKKSDRKFAIIGLVPRVTKDGEKIDCNFNEKENEITTGNNLFKCKIIGEKVEIEFLDKKVEYTPDLLINDVRQKFNKFEIKENTIIWKSYNANRIITITPGGYSEKWEIKKPCRAEVKHNFIGDDLVKIGHGFDSEKKDIKVTVENDSEIYEGTENYPITLFGYNTYYVNSSTVDGHARRSGVNESFADIVAGDGNGANYVSSTIDAFYLTAASSTTWDGLRRSFFVFDTSGLTADANIYDGYTLFYTDYTTNYLNISPVYGLYEVETASNDELVAADYQTVGSVLLSSNTIEHADIVDDEYAGLTLNSIGLSKVNPTGVTKFGIRSHYDATATSPSSHTYPSNGTSWRIYSYLNGTSTEPKLVVFYRDPMYYVDLESGLLKTVELNSEVTLR